MFTLLITTLEAHTIKVGKTAKILNRPINTVATSFMSEEARTEAIKRMDEYNFKRKAEDMIDIIGHISYLYVKL
jgi:hypothetical protein